MVAAVGIKAFQLGAFALGAYPSQDTRATMVNATAVADSAGGELQVRQAAVFALVLGRTANPRVRAWTYSQDGHDFYVLHCGTQETMVFDLTTGECHTFGSGDDDLWRANTGMNWYGSGALPGGYGSDAIVGDDTVGTLYFLAPDNDYDDDPIDAGDNPRSFTRRITTQHAIAEGYNFEPCFGVQVMASIGETADGTVQLEYSDDRGHSWNDAGSISVTSEDYYARLDWRSLGSMQAPGRLFRLTDTGALRRVDNLNMEEVPE